MDAGRYARAGAGRWGRGLIAAVACLLLLAAPVAAQAQRGPEALWEEYPLEGEGSSGIGAPPPAPTPAEGSRAAVPAERPAAGTGTDLTVPLLVTLFALIGVAAFVVARRWWPEPATAVALLEPPAPAPAPPAIVPAPPASAPAGGPPADTAVVGYIHLGAREENADGLDVQESLIRRECAERGWKLLGVMCDDQRTLAAGTGRPGLEAALERVASGEVGCLVVSRLDRLGRSAVELGTVMQELADADVTVVSLDFGIDTSSEPGSLVTDVLAGVAAWERDRIAAGARSGLAAVRAARRRRQSLPSGDDDPDVRNRIAAMRADGMTLQAIADALNAEGVPTLRGGALWRPSSVQAATGYKRPRPAEAHRQEANDA